MPAAAARLSSKAPGACPIHPRTEGVVQVTKVFDSVVEVEDLDGGGEVEAGALPTQATVPK